MKPDLEKNNIRPWAVSTGSIQVQRGEKICNPWRISIDDSFMSRLIYMDFFILYINVGCTKSLTWKKTSVSTLHYSAINLQRSSFIGVPEGKTGDLDDAEDKVSFKFYCSL